MQAVHDMLFAAGINMDSEKQTLLQATLSLQEQLKESQATLLLEQVCLLLSLVLLLAGADTTSSFSFHHLDQLMQHLLATLSVIFLELGC